MPLAASDIDGFKVAINARPTPTGPCDAWLLRARAGLCVPGQRACPLRSTAVDMAPGVARLFSPALEELVQHVACRLATVLRVAGGHGGQFAGLRFARLGVGRARFGSRKGT